jgi:nitroreductase
MEFIETVRRRRMIRSYDPDRPVRPEVLNSILELGIRAPSAGYSQGWRFLVLTDITSRETFWRVTAGGPNPWLDRMRTAPALIVCLSDKSAYLDRYAEPDKGWTDRDEARWPVPYWHVDTGMAAMIMLLAAVNQGLGGCFFGVPPERIPAMLETFRVPHGLWPVGVISLGYPAADLRSPSLRRGRRQVADVVTYESF